MSTKISLGDISTAAGESLDRKTSNFEDTKGSSADQIRWDTLRGKACRLFLSDPDARVHLYYLASNSLASELRTFHALVCEAIVLAESSFSSKEVDAEQEQSLSAKKAALSEQVGKVRFAGAGISSVKSIAAEYLNALASASSKSRRIERGNSGGSLSDIVQEAFVRAKQCSRIMTRLRIVPSRLQQILGSGAVAPILPNLSATLRNSSLPPKEEILRVLTAVGAYEAFTGRASVSVQVHTAARFPYELEPSLDGSVLTLRSEGRAVDPATLALSAGNIVSSGTNSASIVSISGTEMTLSAEIPPSSEIKIQTVAQKQLTSFLSDTISKVSVRKLFSTSYVLQGVSFHKLSRPEAYKIVKTLAPIATMLADLTSEASRSAKVLGVDVSPTEGLLSAVQSFSPPVSSGSEKAVTELLDLLRADGLDIIERGLLSADIPILATQSVNDARLSAKTAFQVGQIMNIINPELKV
jgi:hypothetical protein